MQIQTLILGAMGTNCYFLFDKVGGECAVIDPGDEIRKITAHIGKLKCKVKYIILTHAHFDHMMALEELRAQTGAPLAIHKLDNAALSNPEQTYMSQFAGREDTAKSAEILLEDGMTLDIGGEKISVLHTPGHTIGSICLLVGPDILISGDTLFRGDIGRYDLYGGDYRTLCKSLQRLSLLDGDYRVYPGHGPATRLSYERQHNIEMIQ